MGRWDPGDVVRRRPTELFGKEADQLEAVWVKRDVLTVVLGCTGRVNKRCMVYVDALCYIKKGVFGDKDARRFSLSANGNCGQYHSMLRSPTSRSQWTGTLIGFLVFCSPFIWSSKWHSHMREVVLLNFGL